MLDTKLMRQILRNLIGNALKYSPEGGTVWVHADRHDGIVTLRVTDQGIGIPLEDRAALFEPFHRGTNVGEIQGSGLGLAIVKKAVTSHGGEIAVESTVGRGSVFTVTLSDHPLDRADPTSPVAG
jgi:signal transduction histidine kinase